MPDLTMGANAPIIEEREDLVLKWPASAGSLDCSAFLLSSVGKVRSDDDMIFYNQREDARGSVRLASPDGGDHARFALDLRRVPSEVERIVVCATVDRGGRTMEAFAGLEASYGSGAGAIRFSPDLRGAREVALRIVEIYRRGGAWKLRADGQGYNAGLGPLAESFGVDVDGSDSATAAPAGNAAPPPSGLGDDGLQERSGPGAMQDEPPIVFDVQPVDATFAPQAVRRPPGTCLLQPGGARRLTLSQAAAKEDVLATLSWSSRQGGAEGRARPLRLRLGVFYETRDGSRGALQDPDVRRGPPGDDLLTLLTGTANGPDRDALVVAAGRVRELGLLHLYAVLDGPATWRSSHVELLVEMPGNPAVAMEMSAPDDGCSCVLLASLRIEGAEAALQHLGQPAADQQALDAAMGWNLRWRRPGLV